jgi:hypothetical protein
VRARTFGNNNKSFVQKQPVNDSPAVGSLAGRDDCLDACPERSGYSTIILATGCLLNGRSVDYHEPVFRKFEAQYCWKRLVLALFALDACDPAER